MDNVEEGNVDFALAVGSSVVTALLVEVVVSVVIVVAVVLVVVVVLVLVVNRRLSTHLTLISGTVIGFSGTSKEKKRGCVHSLNETSLSVSKTLAISQH